MEEEEEKLSADDFGSHSNCLMPKVLCGQVAKPCHIRSVHFIQSGDIHSNAFELSSKEETVG